MSAPIPMSSAVRPAMKSHVRALGRETLGADVHREDLLSRAELAEGEDMRLGSAALGRFLGRPSANFERSREVGD